MLSLLANSITKKRCHFIGGIVELCCQCIDAGCAYIQSHVMADINNRTSYSFVNIYIRGHSTVTVFLKLDPGMGLKNAFNNVKCLCGKSHYRWRTLTLDGVLEHRSLLMQVHVLIHFLLLGNSYSLSASELI